MRNVFTTLILLISFVSVGHASDYVVKNIKVDVEAESAIDARGKALNTARRNAFNIVTERLLGGSDKTSMPHANDNMIASMVDSFEINREKLSKNRYLASVNVTFNERAVQAYMGRHTNIALPDQPYQETPVNVPSNGVGEINHDRQIQHSNLYGQYQQNQNTQVRNAVSYKMRIDLKNIREWVKIQKSLEAIGNVSIHSLNAARAIVTVSYQGDATQLQQAMNMKGMQLYSNTQASSYDVPYVLVVRG